MTAVFDQEKGAGVALGRTRQQIFCSFFAGLLFAQAAAGQALSDQAAVDAAAESLRRYRAYPWYDAKQDALHRVDVAPPSDVGNRHSRWEAKPTNWSFPVWVLQLLRTLVWTLLAVGLGVVVYQMIKVFLTRETAAAIRSSRRAMAAVGNADRVESLPFQLARPESDFLSEARRLYEAGRFSEAIIYLYSYQLLQLDELHVIRLARGKTNRQYLREVRRHPVRAILERTMVTFEDVFFGDHSIDRARFEMCWSDLDRFQREAIGVVRAK